MTDHIKAIEDAAEAYANACVERYKVKGMEALQNCVDARSELQAAIRAGVGSGEPVAWKHDLRAQRDALDAARLEIESLKAQLAEHADELAVAYMCGASREKELAVQLVEAPLMGAAGDAGWVMVPKEPTLAMGWAYLDAARESEPLRTHLFNHDGYRAMIAAAPSSAKGVAHG